MDSPRINFGELKSFIVNRSAGLDPQGSEFLWNRLTRWIAIGHRFMVPVHPRERDWSAGANEQNPCPMRIDINEELKETLNLAIDYLMWVQDTGKTGSSNDKSSLMGKTLKSDFDTFIKNAKNWEKKRSRFAEIENGEVTVVDRGEHYFFVLLHSKNSYTREGRNNGVCVGQAMGQFFAHYEASLSGEISTLSLRDSQNRPHATIIVRPYEEPPEIVEISGREDISVHPRHVPTIRKFLETYYDDPRVHPRAELSMGYLTIDGRRHDLLNGEKIPEKVDRNLFIWKSRWPLQFPDIFIFGSSVRFQEAKTREQTLVDFKDFGDPAADTVPRLPYDVLTIKDAHGEIELPKNLQCHGNAMLDFTHAKIWPDCMLIDGDLDAAHTNLKKWRALAHFQVRGNVNLSHSTFECFEPGTYIFQHIDISDTPCEGIPADFVANGNVVARNTPNISYISAESTFGGDLDLSFSGIAFAQAGLEVGFDFIVTGTRRFRHSPAKLRAVNFEARDCALETIGEDTHIDWIIDLTGSNVTCLPPNIYVGVGIFGQDGKYWDMQQNPRDTIAEFNSFYQNHESRPPTSPQRASAVGLAP